MAAVRFANICDHCGKRGEEYCAMPTCSECQKHTCADCDVPTERTEDERNLTFCKGCNTQLFADACADAALDGTFLPSEITEPGTPATPFDDESTEFGARAGKIARREQSAIEAAERGE